MDYKFDAALPEGFTAEPVKSVMEMRGAKWKQRFEAGELQFAEEIWTLPKDRGAVRYVFDHFVEVPYIRAETDIANMATEILSDLESNLPLSYVENFTKQIAPGAPTRRYALRALAAITPIYRGDVINAFKAAIHDPDADFRWLSIACVSRYSSFVFAKELDEQAAVEPDAELQEAQRKLAADLRVNGRRGTQWAR
jgi:hypothetical protein